MDKRRLSHVDAAKGISICLVVFAHGLGAAMQLNLVMIFLRMPVFFVAAGIFAAGALASGWPAFLRTRIANILWLYVLWTFVFFALVVLPPGLVLGRHIDWAAPFRLFVEPPMTLWFLYALAVAYVLARLVHRWPAWVVLTLALAAYCWSVSTGDWHDLTVHEWVMRLFPYFVIASRFSAPLLDFIERHRRAGLPALAAFVAGALYVFPSPLAAWPPVTFALGLLGVFGIFATCRTFAYSAWLQPIAWLGERTLFVFVMHRIPLAYADALLTRLDRFDNLWVRSATTVATIVVTAAVGEFVLKRFAPWSVECPWSARPSRARADGPPADVPRPAAATVNAQP